MGAEKQEFTAETRVDVQMMLETLLLRSGHWPSCSTRADWLRLDRGERRANGNR
jgi:hypothetical protein